MRPSVPDSLASVRMFATLGGAYPAPLLPPSDAQATAHPPQVESLIRAVIAEQAEAGLEPVSDGGLRHPDPLAWLMSALTTGADRSGIASLPAWRSPISVD